MRPFVFRVVHLIGVALLACACGGALQAQPARDPFAAAEAPPADALRGYAVGRYTVHGVLLLRGHALAALQTPGGEFHVVRVGDTIGRDGGEVARITEAGVHVRTAAGIRSLPVAF